jgi:hypothetical protein
MALKLGMVSRGAALVVLLLVSGNAHGQVGSAGNPGPQVVSFERHCDDIRDVFKLASFKGEYRQRADAFVANNCRGTVPYPSLKDPYNVQRFNTSARILQSGGIEIAPN